MTKKQFINLKPGDGVKLKNGWIFDVNKYPWSENKKYFTVESRCFDSENGEAIIFLKEDNTHYSGWFKKYFELYTPIMPEYLKNYD